MNACEPITKSFIVNETGQDLQIIIQLDKNIIKRSYRVPNYAHLFNQFAEEPNVHLADMDSIKLTGRYILSPGARCQVDFGIGKEPNFNFNELTILNKDTIVYTGECMIKQAFVKMTGFTYELRIK